ncbi:MAG: glycosyltransferase [Saprospiraceae bacterium]|nr:glycosyltransferase [Saprospiraceae bacterium]MCB9320350.1 glycosyltransferase [Lewinellaceae bacterium]
MKKVLVLTYYWPPSGGPGVQRILNFCNYLPEFGWQPIVITPKNGTYPVRDESLVKQINPALEIHPTATLEVFALYNLLKTGKATKESPVGMSDVIDSASLFQRLSNYIRANFFIPDPRIGWNRFALAEAAKIFHQGTVDAVITTGPPQSTHLIGLSLKKKFNLPWIADLRDPWVNIFYNRYLLRSERSIRKDQRYENQVLTTADGVTVVSTGLIDEFADRAKNITLIYNGYHSADFNHVIPKVLPENTFHLGYVGSFKPSQNNQNLWKAIAALIRENEDFAKSFALVFVGKAGEGLTRTLGEFGLFKYARMVGYVGHNEAIAYMAGLNSQLFIIPEVEDNKKIITGKLYEYMAVQNQIFSLGPVDGEAAVLLNEFGHDPMLDYNDLQGMKQTLLTQFNRWLDNDRQPVKMGTRPEKYNRRSQTKVLADLLDQLTNASK